MIQEREINCGDVLDISGISEIHGHLKSCLANSEHVVFKAGQISRVDTAALQCLAAFQRDAQHDGLQVRWDSPTDALRRSADLLGIGQLLGLSP